MKIRIIPFQRGDASWQLAVEEALFLSAKKEFLTKGSITPVVRTYSFARPSVILGYGQQVGDIDKDYCKDHKIDVTMRCTGGGSVYLTEKELQYTVITPEPHNFEFLKKTNTRLITALQDKGFSPIIKIANNHPVIRMNNKSFVFDAQRRNPHVLLHHGTTMMDKERQADLFNSLKASTEHKQDIMSGILWLHDLGEIREALLAKAYQKRLAGEEFFVKDLTLKEKKLAEDLHKKFYSSEQAFSFGKKKHGICYLPSTQYNMEKYVVNE